MKKDKIRQRIILTFLILFLCLLFLMMSLLNVVQNDDTVLNTSANQLEVEKKETTKKDIIEKHNSKYIKEGVNYIEVVLAKGLFEENGASNQSYIDNLMEDLMPFYMPNDYYIIDKEKEIEVYARYNEELEGYEFIINEVEDFYSKVNGEDYVKVDTTSIVGGSILGITNDMLDTLQYYSFNFEKIEDKLGEGIELPDGYTSYQNGEILIQNAATGAVKNIIFTKDYNKRITSNLRGGMSLEKVVEQEPNYSFGSLEKGYVGYRNNSYYLFFYDDEVSLYTYSYKKSEDFEKILRLYLESKDLEMFVERLSKYYKAYDCLEYDKETQSARIKYSTRGIDINIKNNDPKGITFYNNSYLSVYIKSLIKTGVVSFEPDKDFVEVAEIERRKNN